MRAVIALFFVAVLTSSVCVAQTAPGFPPSFSQPPRDTSAQPSATAIIRGHVFDGATGQPLRKAQVRAFSPELRENRLAITDNNGAYEIKNVAPGRYSLSANKGSYVGLQYGQTRPLEPGKPLEVLNGQTVEKIDFRLPRGAVVTGRVVDENGEPASDVQVTIMRYQYIGGRRQLQPGRFASTNDIGEFRLFGIPPGQYVVAATLRLPGGPNDAASDDRSGYAPTYYPGSPNVGEAQRITLNVGQTLSDINIALSPTRLARISGSAVDSDGKPLQSAVVMLAQLSGTMIISSTGSQMKPDGTFTIANVAPGDYLVRAIVNAANVFAADQELVQANVTVSGDDINDLRLVGVKPSTMRGRVIPAASQNDVRELQLLAIPKNQTPSPLGGTSNTRVNEDATFELKVQPGSSYIRMNPTGAFASTRIKAVRVNGVDLTDSGIEIRPNEDLNGVEVELTTQMASLSGVVSDARGNAVRDYTVLIFPRDRERWEATSRYLSVARPDQDGRYKAPYMLPGAYYAIALDYVEQGANSDPEFLERVRDRAIEFSISDTETKVLDLKLITGI